MRRAATLRALATTAAATSVPFPGGAQTPAVVRISGNPIDVGGLPYYALDLGIFKRLGLEVELVTLASGGGPAVAAAVAAGSLDVGSANTLSLALAHERGISFVMFGPTGSYSSKSPTAGLLVAKASPLRTARDFNGKTIAVATVSSLGQIATEAWLDRNGGDYRSVRWIEMPYSAMGDAIASGRVDGGVMENPVFDKVLATVGRLFAPTYSAVALDFSEGALFCTAEYARAHTDVLHKIVDAMAEAARWANKNQPLSAKILEKYSKVPQSDLVHRVVYAERLSAASLQPLIDVAAKYGVLKTAFPASEMFAPGFGT